MNLELQQTIYNKLSTDLTEPVFMMGDVDQGYLGLYAVIGHTTMIDWSTDGYIGNEATIIVHSWDTDDSSRGLAKVMGLMDDIYTSLNRATLTISGYNSVGIDLEFNEPMIDPDGITGHGVQRFRLFMRET